MCVGPDAIFLSFEVSAYKKRQLNAECKLQQDVMNFGVRDFISG